MLRSGKCRWIMQPSRDRAALTTSPARRVASCGASCIPAIIGYWGRTMSRTLFTILAICLLAITLAACRDDSRQNATAGNSEATSAATPPGETEGWTAESAADMPYGPRSKSAIDFKGLFNRVPSALDVGRSGEFAFFKMMLSEGEHGVFRVPLHGSGAFEPVELLRDPEQNIAYIKAHPSAAECLVTTNHIAADGHVHNRVWRIAAGLQEEIVYENCEGLPENHLEIWMNNLKPFYSWDGSQVIIPFDQMGVVVCTVGKQDSRFIQLPDPKIQITGFASDALPDSGMGRLVSYIVWEAQSRDEKCRLFTLDLDRLDRYELQADITWIVYNFAAPDLEFDPWVLQGSRLPDYLEAKRQPRLAYFDRESGTLRDIELGGDAEFNLSMDPLGRSTAFMDHNRQGLVLLDLESGESSVDTRWFSTEARIFQTENAQCYVWYKDIFLQSFAD
ncbi:MAG: hypothetical protein R3F46_09250 [bacterium]